MFQLLTKIFAKQFSSQLFVSFQIHPSQWFANNLSKLKRHGSLFILFPNILILFIPDMKYFICIWVLKREGQISTTKVPIEKIHNVSYKKSKKKLRMPFRVNPHLWGKGWKCPATWDNNDNDDPRKCLWMFSHKFKLLLHCYGETPFFYYKL